MLEVCSNYDVVVFGFEFNDLIVCYGCFQMVGDDLLLIVEFKDVIEDQCVIIFYNLGVVCVDVLMLFILLIEVKNENVVGEYYLFDIVVIVCVKGMLVIVVICLIEEMLGVNICVEFVVVEQFF